MPGRIGPLLTTGVALSVAAVVVANPVTAPRADVQIPAVKVKLSGTGDAMDMLNADFLKALGPAPAESSGNPLQVFRDLIASLAADAAYLGRYAIIGAFFAGADAVSTPELTAASSPYVPPTEGGALYPASTGAALWPVPVGAPVESVPMPVSTADLLAIAAIPAELVPAAAEVVMTLLDDARGLGDTAVTAAFAAGALLVSGGSHVVDAVRGLVNGDVAAVLTSVLAAVRSGDPQTAILNAIHDVLEVPASAPRSVVAPAPETAPLTGSSPTGESDPSTPGLSTPSTPNTELVGAERVQRRTATTHTPDAAPAPVVGDDDVIAEVALPEGSGQDDDVARPARRPAPSGPLNDAVNSVRTQTQGALRNAADTMQKTADSLRKAADHAAKAVAGPTGG